MVSVERSHLEALVQSYTQNLYILFILNHRKAHTVLEGRFGIIKMHAKKCISSSLTLHFCAYIHDSSNLCSNKTNIEERQDAA